MSVCYSLSFSSLCSHKFFYAWSFSGDPDAERDNSEFYHEVSSEKV